MPDILSLIKDEDRLSFSQNFSILRPSYLGNRLFPDMKTENLTAEYLRLAQGATVPVMATVHGFDTEAEIASRDAIDKVSVEKLLIKRKINQSERMRLLMNHGVNSDDAIVRYVFDDMGHLADGVVVRAEVAKMEVLATGKMTINENDLDMEVDYGVSADNTNNTITASASSDIMGQIKAIVTKAKLSGRAITEIITSTAVVDKMSANKAIQKLVYGTNGDGMYVSQAQIETLLGAMFGIQKLTTNDDVYRIQKADGSYETKRFYPEDAMTFIATSVLGTFGTGLWGVTPEEEVYGPFTAKSSKQFVTLTQWATTDPVATWTKASGVFIPVLPDPDALYVAKVK